MSLRLLNSIDEFDGDWVHQALIGTYPNLPKITGTSHRPIGNGNANDTYHVALTYAQSPGSAPESVVIKIHSSSPEMAQAAADAGSYGCEYEMTHILPSVPDIRVPDFYHSNISDDHIRTNILMQDLSGFCEAGDQIRGATPAQAIASIKELLCLHKHFWNSPEIASYGWTVPRAPFHHPGHSIIVERLGADLTSEELQIINDSIVHIDQWLDSEPENPTLIHGDCRVDNILFDQTVENDPKAYIIDWANCRVGDAMADITYLLASSVLVEDRPTCEEKAIALYAQEIAKIDPSYSIDQAREEYRQNITSSMFLTLVAAAFIPQTPHTDLLLGTLIRRNCAAHKDWLFS